MNLSFVIPCYRSEHTIIPVLEEIRNKMIEQPEITYEVNTVNDNSPDDVLSVPVSYTHLLPGVLPGGLPWNAPHYPRNH